MRLWKLFPPGNLKMVNICDPLCEIQAKVSKSNYEKVWFLTINFTVISIFDMTFLSQY